MTWNVQTSLCLLPFAEPAHDHRLIWQSTSVQCCQSETVTDHYCKAIWSTRVEKHVLNECHLAGVASNVGSRSLESSRTVWGCITPQHTPLFRGIFFPFYLQSDLFPMSGGVLWLLLGLFLLSSRDWRTLKRPWTCAAAKHVTPKVLFKT